jgi:hypothetical protein
MKLLICGSRDYIPFNKDESIPYRIRVKEQDRQTRLAVVKAVNKFMETYQSEPTVIISGGARGVDTAAMHYALDNSIKFKAMYADWDFYGKSAGMIRNNQMLDECQYVLALWDGKSNGTKHTIENAKKRNIPCMVITK